MMDEWISVKDKLPELGEKVLIYGTCNGEKYYSVDILAPYFDENVERFKSYRWHKEVTHWMPLPEPPPSPLDKGISVYGSPTLTIENTMPDFAQEMKELEEMAEDDSFRIFSLIDLMHRVLEKFQKAKEEKSND